MRRWWRPTKLSVWLQQKGLQNVTGMNPGGTLRALGLQITMVPAMHSSSVEEDGRIIYLGVATGYVITFEDGLTIYFRGRHSIFGDMRLIGEMYRPSIAFLPIGDLYTMGPEQAAKACELLGVKQVVPMHYGTFPALTGTPASCASSSSREACRCWSSNPAKPRLDEEDHEDTKIHEEHEKDLNFVLFVVLILRFL